MGWAGSHFSEAELTKDLVKREAWANTIMLRRTAPNRRHKLPDSEFSLWVRPYFSYGAPT